MHLGLYQLAFMQGDTASMQRQVEWRTGKPDEYAMLSTEAQAVAFSGKLEKARESFRHAIELAQRGNLKENASLIAATEALIEAEFGDYRQARDDAMAAMKISHSRHASALAATALALSGAVSEAQALTDELAKRFPTDTMVNAMRIPTARAAVEVYRGSPAKAIEELRATSPHELGHAADFGPVYIRGLAYLRAKQGTEAAAEFQKILEHRGIDLTSPLYALAYLGLARASRLAGDAAKSRRAYQDFLALWKDADPNIPILQEAKRGYAQLK